jgi:heme iron utilization protein
MSTNDPGIRATDDQARSLARQILAQSRFGALGTFYPGRPATSPSPLVTRVAVAPGETGLPLMLISALSLHARALRENPALSLLLGEAEPKGDALTHPRLTVIGQARFLPPADRSAYRAHWLKHHPKALVYVDLPDFAFVALDPEGALLNGGFGRAYHLDAIDLT